MSARPGTEFANDTVWSAVNNTTARAQALKELAVRDSDAAFEYFTTNLAGDTVGNFAAANTGYGIDVARGKADFSVSGLVKANAVPLVGTAASGTMRLGGTGVVATAASRGGAQVRMPAPVTKQMPLGQRIGRAGGESGLSTTVDTSANALGWRIQETGGSGPTERGRAADTATDIAKDLGKGGRHVFGH